MGPEGFTIWLTGLSGAGKTTVGRALEQRLLKLGLKVEVLDGDEFRERLCADLGYSRQDRDANVRRISYIASLLARNGVVVIVAAISPYRTSRAHARSSNRHFVEVYCRCSLRTAESRDVKGLYARARRGEIKRFTGIDDPYEEPIQPEVLIDTEHQPVSDCVDKICEILEAQSYLRAVPSLASGEHQD